MSYHLLLKTGDSELRAWRNLSDARKSKISVHCEITRGRKKPNRDKEAPAEYNISNVFRAIVDDFKTCVVCVVDLTREPTLASSETELLGDSSDGYSKWVSAVAELHEKNPQVRPTLIVNPKPESDFEQFRADIFGQCDSFMSKYDLLAYRVSVLHDEGFLGDIELLADRINRFTASGGRFEVLLDFECIQPSTAPLHASYASSAIRTLREIIPEASIVSLGTSFPKSVTDLGDEERDEFRLEEVYLNEEINRGQNRPVEYGDYGSINPIRNDIVVPVGAHMRARVDFPTSDNRIFYWRVAPTVDKETSKLIVPRSQMYKLAAKLVAQDPSFSPVADSWGYERILEAANQAPEGSNAAFWISVRMEIHICRRVDALFGLNSLGEQ